MRLAKTWGGRITILLFIAGLIIGPTELYYFWIAGIVCALLTYLGHIFYVQKIREKYGDELFSLSAYEIPEVKTYFATLSEKEKLEDNAYIKAMIKRRGH
jgi:hypothetical protein